MRTRPAWFLPVSMLLVLAGCATAPEAPVPLAAEPVPTVTATLADAPPVPPAAAITRIAVTPFIVDPWHRLAGPGRPGQPAPVPNRGLDPAFEQPSADPSFGPSLIGPRAPPDLSTAIGPGHLRTRDDRLFQQPAAGAALRVPLDP